MKRVTLFLSSVFVLLSVVFIAPAPRAEAASNAVYVMITSVNSGQCLNVEGGGSTNGAPVIQWPCTNGLNDNWTVRQVAGSANFQIVVQGSGQCLNVQGGSTANGAAVVQWPCVGASNERWSLRLVSGTYQIVAEHSGLCLNVAGGSTANGARVIQWPCVGSTNEQWRIPALVSSFSMTPNQLGYWLKVNGVGFVATSVVEVFFKHPTTGWRKIKGISTASNGTFAHDDTQFSNSYISCSELGLANQGSSESNNFKVTDAAGHVVFRTASVRC